MPIKAAVSLRAELKRRGDPAATVFGKGYDFVSCLSSPTGSWLLGLTYGHAVCVVHQLAHDRYLASQGPYRLRHLAIDCHYHYRFIDYQEILKLGRLLTDESTRGPASL